MANHVWIELQRPDRNDSAEKQDAFAEQQCALANRMLERLCKPEDLPIRDSFGWSTYRRLYTYGGVMGRLYLTDYGTHFNLDYFGRSE